MLLFTCTLVGFGYFYLLFVWGPLFWESSFCLSFNISSCLRFRFFIYLVRISDLRVQKEEGEKQNPLECDVRFSCNPFSTIFSLSLNRTTFIFFLMVSPIHHRFISSYWSWWRDPQCKTWSSAGFVRTQTWIIINTKKAGGTLSTGEKKKMVACILELVWPNFFSLSGRWNPHPLKNNTQWR